MSLTPDPFLLQAHRVDASRLPDNRAVHVGGNVEQKQPRAHRCTGWTCHHALACPDKHCPGHPSKLEQRLQQAGKPHPYKLAALINWLIVVGCMLTLSVLSVPELREAAAQAIGQFIAR